jgi:hypothetical protein
MASCIFLVIPSPIQSQAQGKQVNWISSELEVTLKSYTDCGLCTVVPAEHYHGSIIQGTRLIEQDNPKNMREMQEDVRQVFDQPKCESLQHIWYLGYLDKKNLSQIHQKWNLNSKMPIQKPEKLKGLEDWFRQIQTRSNEFNDLYCWLNLKLNIALRRQAGGLERGKQVGKQVYRWFR